MFDLALSILFSTSIFVVFKLYAIFKIETLYAIITNYVVASSVGFFFYNGTMQIETIPDKPWFWGTIVLGVLFIVVFNLMAATSQKVGVSAASVATKMSLVIPVLAGVILYNEILSEFQILGIILALAAVYFASAKETSLALLKSSLLLPLLVFLGSGIIDASIKYIQAVHIGESDFPIFSATVFASAAFTGMLFISIKSVRTPLRVNLKNILGGVVLGILNYFSIYFILKALQHPSLSSAAVFTINNVAIVLFSTLLGIILFKERLTTKNWGGIALAIISIALVALF